MANYLVQDIETIPETEIADMWDPAKAAPNKRYPGEDPFPPIWCHKVVCIGMLALDQGFHPRKGGCAAGGLVGGKSEKEMIERWGFAASGEMWGQDEPLKMVDYNGRGFDVPVLQTRAFRYGVRLPWYFGKIPDNKGEISNFSKRYRDRFGGWHLDVQELWSNKGAFRYPHLENLARLMGLPGKCGFDGSKVHQAWKDEQFAEIDRYCMEDVFQTAFIFQRYQLLAGKMSLEQYREAAQAMLDFVKKSENHDDFLEKIDRAAVLLEEV
jgi:predicted PolB exonuclease-like 3'-5' exonuclease